MKTLLLLVALLPATAAEQPKKKPAPVNPCAQYGAGWVVVAGTNTCVKVSGSIQVDIGR